MGQRELGKVGHRKKTPMEVGERDASGSESHVDMCLMEKTKENNSNACAQHG